MIWLIGAKGMLGREVSIALKRNNLDYIATDIEIDITNYEILKEFINKYNFRYIINCAAYTNVDKAENDIENVFNLNSKSLKFITELIKEKDITLIHFSTDYVFNGDKISAYIENDETFPLSIYGSSKLKGENYIISNLEKYYIFRISWLYGMYGNNFVKTMVNLMKSKKELRVVFDQVGAPTYTKNLVKNLIFLILNDNNNFGIYHYQDYSKNAISWYEFAREIKRNLETNENFKILCENILPVSSNEYKTVAIRPKNSFFNTNKVKNILKFKVNSWNENLRSFLSDLI